MPRVTKKANAFVLGLATYVRFSLQTNTSLRVVKSGMLTYLTFTHGTVSLPNRH
jgi:hypothetical protein